MRNLHCFNLLARQGFRPVVLVLNFCLLAMKFLVAYITSYELCKQLTWRRSLTVLLVLVISNSLYAQALDRLMLNDSEIPAGYSRSKKLVFHTVPARSFYEQTDLYSFLGSITKKEIQSFGKGNKGSIIFP